MERIQRRSPVVTGIFATLVIGLGQIYNGQLLKGILLFILSLWTVVFCFLTADYWLSLIGCLVLFSVIYIFAIIDAIIVAFKRKEYQLRPFNRWYIYMLVIIVIICVFYPFIILNFPVKAYVVTGISMSPTFLVGEKFMVSDNPGYTPERGEVVLFKHPTNPGRILFKRVLALEGEKLKFNKSKIYINGVEVKKTWETTPNQLDRAYSLVNQEFEIPKGNVFVIGDNIDGSMDSRSFGPISIKTIKGKALYFLWSAKKMKIGKKI